MGRVQRRAQEAECKAAEAEQAGALKALRGELDASLNGKRKQQTQRRALLERIAALEQKVAAAACAPLPPCDMRGCLHRLQVSWDLFDRRAMARARGAGRRSTARRRSGAWRRR